MTEADTRIRIAAKSDITSLVEFNQAMAIETEGKRLVPETITAGAEAVFDDPAKGFYVVVESNGAIVGGLLVTNEWSDWRNAWFWWIQSVYIIPDFRGRSLYSRMYRFVKEQAAAAGNVCGFRLYVENDNLHAQKVYESLGMVASHYLMYEEEVEA